MKTIDHMTAVSANFWGDNGVANTNYGKSSRIVTEQNLSTDDYSICDHILVASIFDHISTSLPFAMISEENTELQQVLNILDSADDTILLDDDVATKEEIALEPIPLGPMASLNLVQQIPLIESARNLLQNTNQVDMEALFDALSPLMIKSRSTTRVSSCADSCFMSKKKQVSTTASLSLPTPEERHRVESVATNDDEALLKISAKINQDTISKKEQKEDQGTDGVRFRPYQYSLWKDRFQDLVDFRKKNGHCQVPHHFPENPQLAQWIKRQRFQYKLKQKNSHTTLTDERQTALETIGFVWDSHKAAWIEHFESLKEFQARHGHCIVPSNYVDRPLAIWVKCQRRQCKLFKRGSRSNMTVGRITQLDHIGFCWNPRNLK